MNPKTCFVEMNDVSLVYDLHLDRTDNLKEFIINAVTRRKYVQKRKSKHTALDHLNLKINEGERVGIIGFNGSGKSTLLKVISGILKPTEGKIISRGAVQPLIEIGAGFHPEFTGRENIYFNGYMLGFTKKQILEKEKEIIRFADLGEYIDTPTKYYSSGMAVRLAFTIATMVRPEILLIDEMLAAGDAAFILKAKERLSHLIDIAKILVLVSHDLDFVASLCSRVIVLDKGKVSFDGPATESLRHYSQLVNQANQAPQKELS